MYERSPVPPLWSTNPQNRKASRDFRERVFYGLNRTSKTQQLICMVTVVIKRCAYIINIRKILEYIRKICKCKGHFKTHILRHNIINVLFCNNKVYFNLK